MKSKIKLKNFFTFFFSRYLLTLSCVALHTQECISFEIDNWISIDPEGIFFINEHLFPRDKHLRRVLEMQNISQTSSDGVNSMELFTEYDCKKGTFRLLNHRSFSNKNLKGEFKHTVKYLNSNYLMLGEYVRDNVKGIISSSFMSQHHTFNNITNCIYVVYVCL